jgi:hypothetical protein
VSPLLVSIRICWICGKAVDLETSKTDERGSAVHGECYSAKMMRTRAIRQERSHQILKSTDQNNRGGPDALGAHLSDHD